MFPRVASFFLVATLAASVLATGGGGDTNQCNGGSVQCCNQVQEAKAADASVKNFLGLIGVALDQITGDIGVSCTAVNVLGVGGGQKCSQQQVCCTGNNYNGIVTLGCTPINVQV